MKTGHKAVKNQFQTAARRAEALIF